MSKQSAGLLLYRSTKEGIEFFLVHPGGPFWAKKDIGAWSIPKGEFDDDEDPLAAARREFREETGFTPEGDYIELSPQKLKSGKTVYAWVVEGEFDPAALKSNTFELEWPPKSGKIEAFPEVDRGAWFRYELAAEKINPRQVAFLDETLERLKTGGAAKM